jgi:hypothetical protein
VSASAKGWGEAKVGLEILQPEEPTLSPPHRTTTASSSSRGEGMVCAVGGNGVGGITAGARVERTPMRHPPMRHSDVEEDGAGVLESALAVAGLWRR